MFYYVTPVSFQLANGYPYLQNPTNLFLVNSEQIQVQVPQIPGGLYTNFNGEVCSRSEHDLYPQQNVLADSCFHKSQQILFNFTNQAKKIELNKYEQSQKASNTIIKDSSDSTSKQEGHRGNEGQDQTPKKKKSETKNLIKNYGRAILTFVIKNKELRRKVLSHLGIDEAEFLEEVHSYRNHIHTISAIRYLWQYHPFCKAFRILSCEYLRKYNMEHIFNSRVFRHSVYLKYQQKLMRSMQRPQQFESIKED